MIKKVEFYRHSLSDVEKSAALGVLDSLFLTTGPKTREFEKKFSDYMKVRYCIGLSSCTAGLFLVLKALGIGKGDKVVVPAMTFIATSNSVLHAGAEVIFADVDKETGLIDLNQVENILKNERNVKAVMPVHLYGQMVNMMAMRKLADRFGVKIVEDAAHCVEGERDGFKPGHLSEAAVFSFYATKNITSGDGGAVITNDDSLAEKLKILRLHGMSKSAIDRHESYHHWDMEVLGYKANMSDLQAALLIPQIDRIEKKLETREEIAMKYEASFPNASIEYPETKPHVKHARHLFTFWAKGAKRDGTIRCLQDKGIGCAVNYRAVHLMKFYRDTFGYKRGDFPNAEYIGDRTISIPFYPSLTDNEIDYVITNVIECYNKA